MKLVIVCVRDVKAGSFGNPQFVPAIGVGIRSFTDAINNPQDDNVLYKHAVDFELYHLGSFDCDDCTFDLLERPKCLVLGSDVQDRFSGKEVSRVS